MTFSFSFGLDTIFDPEENLSWDEKEALLAIRDREAEDALSIRNQFRVDQVKLTSDSNSVGTTTYIDAWSSGLADVKVRAGVGDWVQLTASFKWGNNATVTAACDFRVVKSSRYVSTGTTTPATEGIGAWYGNVNSEATVGKGVGGTVWYQIQSGDVDNGYVTFRPRINATAPSRTITGNASWPAMFSAANFGQST